MSISNGQSDIKMQRAHGLKILKGFIAQYKKNPKTIRQLSAPKIEPFWWSNYFLWVCLVQFCDWYQCWSIHVRSVWILCTKAQTLSLLTQFFLKIASCNCLFVTPVMSVWTPPHWCQIESFKCSYYSIYSRSERHVSSRGHQLEMLLVRNVSEQRKEKRTGVGVTAGGCWSLKS